MVWSARLVTTQVSFTRPPLCARPGPVSSKASDLEVATVHWRVHHPIITATTVTRMACKAWARGVRAGLFARLTSCHSGRSHVSPRACRAFVAPVLMKYGAQYRFHRTVRGACYSAQRIVGHHGRPHWGAWGLAATWGRAQAGSLRQRPAHACCYPGPSHPSPGSSTSVCWPVPQGARTQPGVVVVQVCWAGWRCGPGWVGAVLFLARAGGHGLRA